MKQFLLFFLFAILFCTILVNKVSAQWMLVSSPSGSGYLRCTDFLKDGADLFAGTRGGGVFVTTDNGTSWNAINNGLTDKNVNALFKANTKLFAVTQSELFMTTNNGANWTVSNNGLAFATAIANSGSNLYAVSNGIFISTDEGNSWNPTGLTNRFVRSIAVSESKIYTSAFAYFNESGIFFSEDEGSNWLKINNDIPDTAVHTIIVDGSDIYALVEPGVFVSTNGGQNWYDANNGLPPDSYELYFALSGSNIFAGTYGSGVFLSTNKGLNWIDVNDTYNNKFISALTVIDGYVYAGTYNGVVYKRPLSEMITGVDAIEGIPINYDLSQNYPNPFNPSTKINYSIAEFSQVALKIYDVLGIEIATLVNGEKPSGSYEVNFNASQLSSGIYFYKLQAGNFISTMKMILLK